MRKGTTQQLTAADYRIQNVQKCNVKGRHVKIFKAYRNAGYHFEFVGQFTAPQKTSDGALWRVADASLRVIR